MEYRAGARGAPHIRWVPHSFALFANEWEITMLGRGCPTHSQVLRMCGRPTHSVIKKSRRFSFGFGRFRAHSTPVRATTIPHSFVKSANEWGTRLADHGAQIGTLVFEDEVVVSARPHPVRGQEKLFDRSSG